MPVSMQIIYSHSPIYLDIILLLPVLNRCFFFNFTLSLLFVCIFIIIIMIYYYIATHSFSFVVSGRFMLTYSIIILKGAYVQFLLAFLYLSYQIIPISPLPFGHYSKFAADADNILLQAAVVCSNRCSFTLPTQWYGTSLFTLILYVLVLSQKRPPFNYVCLIIH